MTSNHIGGRQHLRIVLGITALALLAGGAGALSGGGDAGGMNGSG